MQTRRRGVLLNFQHRRNAIMPTPIDTVSGDQVTIDAFEEIVERGPTYRLFAFEDTAGERRLTIVGVYTTVEGQYIRNDQGELLECGDTLSEPLGVKGRAALRQTLWKMLQAFEHPMLPLGTRTLRY
jgi:hypothetical protein